jgi:hypothetical protein
VPWKEGKRSEKDGVCRRTKHKEMARAQTRKDFVMLIVVSCGNRDRERWRTELDLGSSESLDDRHRPTALGAQPKIARAGAGNILLGLWFWC